MVGRECVCDRSNDQTLGFICLHHFTPFEYGLHHCTIIAINLTLVFSSGEKINKEE